MSVDLSKYRRTFLGQCMGVGLRDRGPRDRHQMVCLLVEDDENWFEKACISSHWLDELISVLESARAALKGADYKPDVTDNRQYGYRR